MQLNDTQKSQGSLDLTDFDMDKILDEVLKLKVSYAGELSRRVMIHREKVLMIMHQLVMMGKLEILETPPYNVPWQIKRRLTYFHAMGITCQRQFMQRQWVIIPEPEQSQEQTIKEEIVHA